MINVKIDSRKVVKGDTFVAIKGYTVDGHDYIKQAIDNGAIKIICEHDIEENIDYEVVSSSEEWLDNYLVNNYSSNVNKLDIIAITGTSGKTTSAYLTYQLLNNLGIKTAYIGTIGFYMPDKEMVELPNTTPNILDLYTLLLDALDNNCEKVIMEVSSHALALGRIKGLRFKVGVFTNLSQDHLDYHKTMEEYLEAKLLLINYVDGEMLINADDKMAYAWIDRCTNYKTYGYKGNNIKLISYEDLLDGTIVNFNYMNNNYEVKINLKNEYNVYNYLSSIGIALSLGSKIDDVIKVTNNIYPPKGRCDIVKVNKGIAVIDYAHKPDAVEKIISAFNKNKKGKIITVIGCGGDRDATKRPIMGEIASRLSDYVIFTSDNPRTEDPNKILDDIIAGVKKDNYVVEEDRVKAIRMALDMIEDNTVVLILGKGHEDYQIIGHEKHHLDDKEEVLKYMS